MFLSPLPCRLLATVDNWKRPPSQRGRSGMHVSAADSFLPRGRKAEVSQVPGQLPQIYASNRSSHLPNDKERWPVCWEKNSSSSQIRVVVGEMFPINVLSEKIWWGAVFLCWSQKVQSTVFFQKSPVPKGYQVRLKHTSWHYFLHCFD